MSVLSLLNPLNLIEDFLDAFRKNDPAEEDKRRGRIAAKMTGQEPLK